jgi:DNA-binding MarR family transcriptional regulator
MVGRPETDAQARENRGDRSQAKNKRCDVTDARRSAVCRALVLTREFSAEVSHQLARRHGDVFDANHVLAVLLTVALEGPQRPGRLAATARLSPGAMSNMLGRLETAGLVHRSHELEQGDGRAVFVDLTEPGRAEITAVCDTVVDCMRRSATTLKEILTVLDGLADPPSRREAGPSAGSSPMQATRELAELGLELQDALSEIGLGGVADPSASLVLAAVAVTDDCHPGQLDELMGLTSSGISRLIDRLEHAGLVERVTDPDRHDHRTVTMRLTAAGSDHVDRMVGEVACMVGELRSVIAAIVREFDVIG